ncbi:MAG: hypothetical protein QOI21_5891 [Actinomycetota bacterium]|jgi:hypothetical protein|nr:hypothetical protein [Actinomycetota bacterium]
MIIWGFRNKVFQLAMVSYVCRYCSNPAAHALRKVVNKFTLFFIPLFPVSTKYFTQCTFCGATDQLTKEQAEQVQGMGAVQQSPPAQPLG